MILVYDTETTGRPINYKRPPSTDTNWPRIVQLGYACYSDDGKLILTSNAIIKSDGWAITEEAAAIHGITIEKANAEGVPLREAMLVFCQLHKAATVTVCHNAGFDYPVVESERMRIGFKYELATRPVVCTMIKATDHCAIPSPYANQRYKWPSLQELHTHLFGSGFEGGHDALADVLITGKCYFEMKARGWLDGKYNPYQ